MGKIINEIRRAYGMKEIENGDKVLINKIEVCNDKCANYLLIKYEKLSTNNICNKCNMKNSQKVKEVLNLNREENKYKKKVEKILYEV